MEMCIPNSDRGIGGAGNFCVKAMLAVEKAGGGAVLVVNCWLQAIAINNPQLTNIQVKNFRN
jgi:hypothetical protein